MKGAALVACIAVGLVGMGLLLVFPSGMCEQVREYEPNQPLREHTCRPPEVCAGMEERHGVGGPEVTVEL